MIETPPIPPNCPHFVKCGDVWVFSAVGCFPADSKLWVKGSWPWPLNDVEPYQYPIIGYAGRCGWIDEADRILDDMSKLDADFYERDSGQWMTMVKHYATILDIHDHDRNHLIKKRCTAMDAVDAWKVYGAR